MKLINMNILQVKKYYRLIKETAFTYSPLDKVFEKQVKVIEDQREKQINALDNHGKQLVKCSREN